MAAILKDKQFYDTLESTASTRFSDTGFTRRQESLVQKAKSIQSPDNTIKHKQQQEYEEIDEEFTQNFKEHYDIAEDALMQGKKVSRDCKLEENDLEYELNVLRIKIQKELNEIEFSLQPTMDKTWQRLNIQHTNFISTNSDCQKHCKLLHCDFDEIQFGVNELVARMKELERKTGNWQMFKKGENNQNSSPSQKKAN